MRWNWDRNNTYVIYRKWYSNAVMVLREWFRRKHLKLLGNRLVTAFKPENMIHHRMHLDERNKVRPIATQIHTKFLDCRRCVVELSRKRELHLFSGEVGFSEVPPHYLSPQWCSCCDTRRIRTHSPRIMSRHAEPLHHGTSVKHINVHESIDMQGVSLHTYHYDTIYWINIL